MAFNNSNYSESAVYTEYKNVFDSIVANPAVISDLDFSSYSVLSNLKFPDYSFDDVASLNIADTSRLKTYYNSMLSYFFIRNVCSDEVSQIKNSGKSFEELKIPIDYFTDGRVFGIKTRFDSIKNGIPLEKNSGWNFFESFDETKKVSNTDDLNKVVEGIFYNTIYKYFNIDGYYQTELANSFIPYTTKGKTIVNQKGQVVYVNGKGESPNYLNVSVNSFQKVKNKVSIKTTATRTNYNSSIVPPRQVVFKDTNQEFLSGFSIRKADSIASKPEDKNLMLLTSVSDETLITIRRYVTSIVEYFNLIHYVLKNAVIDFEFYKKYSSSEEDIFFDYDKNILIFLQYSSYKNDPNVSKLGIYTKELIINLLNLVGDETTLNNTCNTLLDFIEQNEPQILGNYNRQELLDILKRLNKAAFNTFKEPYPQILLPSTDGKVSTTLNLVEIGFQNQVVHSNDLILQKVHVFRTKERPVIYEDILQEENLYKTLSLNEINSKVIDDGVTLIDDIDTNTKYYYCFLSEREYNVYKEVFTDIPGSRMVRHFSSPTKVLELELISTENSTYLDYSFFVPQEKEFYNKKKNFLSKIKISASDLQKTYDAELERFIAPKDTMQLWDSTTKLVNSDDLTRGLTVKLRLSSPKTNRKLDLNLRYFLNNYPNIGDKNTPITIKDLNQIFGDKKIKEVYSHLAPEVLLEITDKNKKAFVDLRYNFETLKFFINLPQLYLNAAVKNPTYPTYITKLNTNVTFFLGNSQRKYITAYSNSFSKVPYSEAEKIFNSEGEIKFLAQDVLLEDAPGFSNRLIIDNLLPEYSKYLKVVFSITDEFDIVYNSDLTYLLNSIIPATIELSNGINTVNEGDSVRFTIKTSGLNNGKELFWDLEGSNIDDIDFEFAEYSDGLNTVKRAVFGVDQVSQGKIVIFDNSATLKIGIAKDLRTDGQKSFKVNLRSAQANVLGGGDIIAISPEVIINDTSTKPLEFYFIKYGFNTSQTLNEGDRLQLLIESPDVKELDEYYWEVIPKSGILDASDFMENVTAGKLVFNNDKKAYLPDLNIKQDLLTEGLETFVIVVRKSAGSNILATSDTYTINDTSTQQKTFKVVPDLFARNEGTMISFYVYTSNVPLGTVLYWDLFGNNITSGDFTQTNGTFTINSGNLTSGQGIFNTTITNDLITEGVEKFSVNVRETPNGPVVAKTDEVTINDTSFVPALSANGQLLKSKLQAIGITLNNDLTADIKSQDVGNVVRGGGYKYDPSTGAYLNTPYYTVDSDFRVAVLHAGLVSSANTTIKVKFTDLGNKTKFFGSEKIYFDTIEGVSKKIITSDLPLFFGATFAAFSISLA